MKTKKQTCKRLFLDRQGMRPLIILGVVTSDKPDHFVFRSGCGREYTVGKNLNFSLEDTEIVFRDMSDPLRKW